jgi:hypothetical protein
MRVSELLVWGIEIVALFVWPRLRHRLSVIASDLMPDLPELGGHWVAHFQDPTPAGPQPLAVEVELQQFGRSLRGEGRILAQPGDVFDFRGTIRRNVFFGSFARHDSRVLAGSGAFVLKIVADSKHLRGSCLWYDGSLDDVWVSPYRWQRIPISASQRSLPQFVEVYLGNESIQSSR